MTTYQRRQLVMFTALTVVAFALVLVYWLNSPMYEAEKESMRQQAREILIRTYYYDEVEVDRAEWLSKYGLTEDEINPESILLRVANEAD